MLRNEFTKGKLQALPIFSQHNIHRSQNMKQDPET